MFCIIIFQTHTKISFQHGDKVHRCSMFNHVIHKAINEFIPEVSQNYRGILARFPVGFVRKSRLPVGLELFVCLEVNQRQNM